MSDTQSVEFPTPEPSKEEVLKMAEAWLVAHEQAESVGASHLLIHRLYVALQAAT